MGTRAVTKLLLDPALISTRGVDVADYVDVGKYWDRVVAWAGDRRVVTGQGGAALLWSELGPVVFGAMGAMGTSHPLQRDGTSLLAELLSRVQEAPHQESH